MVVFIPSRQYWQTVTSWDYLNQEIGERAAVPKEVTIIEEMPLTPVGKIFKPALRWKAMQKVYQSELEALNDLITSLDVTVTEELLTIRGTMKHKLQREGEGYSGIGRSHDSFSRSLRLTCPINVDEVTATYKDGVLRIVLPRCKPEQGRSIKVKVR